MILPAQMIRRRAKMLTPFVERSVCEMSGMSYGLSVAGYDVRIAQDIWRGFLTLELTNHSKRPISLRAGSPIAQIIFHLLVAPAETPYSGKFQDQREGPVGPRFENAEGSFREI